MATAAAELEAARTEVQGRNAAAEARQKEVEAAQAEARKYAERRKEAQREQKSALRQRDDAERVRAEAEEEATEARKAYEELRGSADAVRQRRLDEREKVRGALDAAKKQHEAAEAKIAELARAADAAAANADLAEQRDDATRRRRGAAEAALRECKAQKNDGSHIDKAMPALLKELAKAKWPSGAAPFGPLGMHVAIKPGRAHWMLALEVMFGRFSGLSAFCVESHADEKAFRKLFADRTDATARLAKQVRVVVSPSEKRFTVRTPPPPPEGEWALDVLELKGDRAFNMALNMASPHERLLVDGDAMAKRVVFGGAAERTAFAANGDKHYKRRNACSAGFFDGTEKRGGAPTAAGLFANADERELRQLREGELRDAAAAADETAAAAASAGRLKKEAAAALAKGKAELGRAEKARVAAHRAAGGDDGDDGDGEGDEISEALREATEAEGRLRRAAEAVAARDRHVESAGAAARTAQEKGKAAEASLHGLLKEAPADEAREVEKRLRDAMRREEGAKKKAKEARDDAAAKAKRAADAKEKADADEARVRDEWGAPPAGGGGRGAAGADAVVEAAADVAKLEAEVRKLKTLFNKSERELSAAGDGGTATQARLDEEEARARAELDGHKAQGVVCEATHAAVAKAVKERAKFCFQAAKVAADQVKADFNRSMSHKGMAGAVHVSHKEETLDIEVATSSQDANAHTTTSIGSLSGGEQAFSMLCFALAMWQYSATPFRAMDEFDKNMDPTFQKVSLSLLYSIFREQSDRQFLILSPLDYKSLLADAGIPKAEIDATTFLKLKAPRG